MKLCRLYRELLHYKLHKHETNMKLEQVQKGLNNLSNQLGALRQDIQKMSSDQESNDKRIDQILESTGNIDFNVRTSMNGASRNDDYKNMLQSQLSAYEKDLHLKLMRKYVVDSIIDLYIMVLDLTRNQVITSDASELFIQRIENDLNQIGIIVYKSSSGDSFNSDSMCTGIFSNVKTKNELMVGKVAQSIYPAFIWNLPTVGLQSSSMLLKEEMVTLYEL